MAQGLDPIKVPLEGDISGLKKSLADAEALTKQSVSRIAAARKKGDLTFKQAQKARTQILKKAEQDRINIIIKNQKTIEQQSKTTSKNMAADFAKAFAKIAIGVIAIKKIGSGFLSLAKEAAQAKAAVTGLAKIVEFKLGKEAVPKAKKALDELTKSGFMDRKAAATAIKNLTSVGFALDETTDILLRNIDIAIQNRQAAFTVSEAVEKFSEGIKNQNSLLSDSTGITKNLSIMLGEFGFTMQDLDDPLKSVGARASLFKSIMKETAPFVGAAEEATKKFGGALAKTETEVTKTRIALGQTIGEVIKPLIIFLGELVAKFRNFFVNLAPGSKIVLIFGAALAAIIPAIIGIVSGLVALSAAMIIGLGPIFAVIAVIGLLVVGFILLNETIASENKRRAKNLGLIESAKKRYIELIKVQKKTVEEQKELLKIQKLFGKEIPGFVSGIDKLGDAHERNIIKINGEINARRIHRAELEKDVKRDPFVQKEIDLQKQLAEQIKENNELEEERFDIKQKAVEDGRAARFDELDDINQINLKIADGTFAIQETRDELKKNQEAFSKIDKKVKKIGVGLEKWKKPPGDLKVILSDNILLLDEWSVKLRTINDQFEKEEKILIKNKWLIRQAGESQEEFRKKVADTTPEQEKLNKKQQEGVRERKQGFAELKSGIDRLNTGLGGFRDGLQGISDKDMPAVISGIGGMVMAFNPLIGGIVIGLGATLDILGDILSGEDELEKAKDRQLKQIERAERAGERTLARLKLEIALRTSLVDIEKARNDLIFLNLQMAEAVIGLFGTPEEQLAAKKETLGTLEQQGLIPGGFNVETKKGLLKAGEFISSETTRQQALQVINDLISGVDLSKLTSSELNDLGFAISAINIGDVIGTDPDIFNLTETIFDLAQFRSSVEHFQKVGATKFGIREQEKVFKIALERGTTIGQAEEFITEKVDVIQADVDALNKAIGLGIEIIELGRDIRQEEKADFIAALKDISGDAASTIEANIFTQEDILKRAGESDKDFQDRQLQSDKDLAEKNAAIAQEALDEIVEQTGLTTNINLLTKKINNTGDEFKNEQRQAVIDAIKFAELQNDILQEISDKADEPPDEPLADPLEAELRFKEEEQEKIQRRISALDLLGLSDEDIKKSEIQFQNELLAALTKETDFEGLDLGIASNVEKLIKDIEESENVFEEAILEMILAQIEVINSATEKLDEIIIEDPFEKILATAGRLRRERDIKIKGLFLDQELTDEQRESQIKDIQEDFLATLTEFSKASEFTLEGLTFETSEEVGDLVNSVLETFGKEFEGPLFEMILAQAGVVKTITDKLDEANDKIADIKFQGERSFSAFIDVGAQLLRSAQGAFALSPVTDATLPPGLGNISATVASIQKKSVQERMLVDLNTLVDLARDRNAFLSQIANKDFSAEFIRADADIQLNSF